MKYLISQADIDWSYDRFKNKGGWGEYKTRKGYIGLWDRNVYKFIWFKIVKRCMDKYAYICERRGNFLSPYWTGSIKPVLPLHPQKNKGDYYGKI